MITVDKNGKEINKGDTVDVAAPTKADLHRYQFRGSVVDTYGGTDNVILVSDQDGDCFDVDPESVTVV